MRKTLKRSQLASVAGLICATALAESGGLAPQIDHHQHLLSPQAAAVLNNPKHTVEMPAGVRQVLQLHEAAWNDPGRLSSIYSADAVAMDGDEEKWRRGRDDVAAFIGTRFARPYSITPVAYTGNEHRGHLAAYYSRGEGAERRHFGSVMINLIREGDQWRIAVLYPRFPGPPHQGPLDAERLVALLDAAQIERAVVLSVAYWFDSPSMPLARSAEAVHAENAWTADQAARYPDRLVAFCSLNPVSEIALNVLRQCAADRRFKGLKLHFATSQVDLLNSDHVRRVRDVFAAANRARFPIVVHLRGGDEYGAAQARVFIEQVLPATPDVPVQIAHLWGGGAFAAEALGVYADAVAARRPATRRLYFDVSDAALVASTPELAQIVADRIRQIGLDRLLYGSDAAFDNHPDPQESWAAFRKGIPLTTAELEKIAGNVAPYLAEQVER
jgi:predicted TIM-barrel fold metal-dependent hydrolase